MSLNTIVFNDINSQIFDCFLGHIGGNKNEETDVSLYDIVDETVRRNGEIIDYGVKPSSPLEFDFTLIKCGEDKHFALDEIRQIVRWLQPDKDYHWLYGIDDENSHEEIIYYLCRITNIKKYKFGGNIIGLTATVRCNTNHGYSEEQIHTFNCFNTEGTTFKIFNDSDILDEVVRPQVTFNFSATGTNEETGETITIPSSYWAKHTTLENDELEGAVVGDVINSDSYRMNTYNDLNASITELQNTCIDCISYMGSHPYTPEFALAILKYDAGLTNIIDGLEGKVELISSMLNKTDSDNFQDLYTKITEQFNDINLKAYAEDVLEVVAKKITATTTFFVTKASIRLNLNTIVTEAQKLINYYKDNIYPISKGYYNEGNYLERSSSLYLNPIEIDTTGNYKLLYDQKIYDDSQFINGGGDYFTKVILYVSSNANSKVIEFNNISDMIEYDDNFITWDNEIGLNAGDTVTVVLEHSGSESEGYVDYTKLDESLRDDNGVLDGNKKTSTQQLANAFHLVLKNNITQKSSGYINISNNTTGVTSKITNISLNETVNLDCHNQIISSSVPNKIFSDDFNRNWIGLVHGYNEFTVDSFGTITIKFREARKVGDLL